MRNTLLALALVAACASCVRVESYDAAISDLTAARAEAAQRGAQAAALEVERANDAKKIDDLAAQNGELSQRLRALGQACHPDPVGQPTTIAH